MAWFCIGGCFNPQLLAEVLSLNYQAFHEQLRCADSHRVRATMAHRTDSRASGVVSNAEKGTVKGTLGILHCIICAPHDKLCPIHSSFCSDLATARDGVHAYFDKGNHTAVCQTYKSENFADLIDIYSRWDGMLANGYALDDLPPRRPFWHHP